MIVQMQHIKLGLYPFEIEGNDEWQMWAFIEDFCDFIWAFVINFINIKLTKNTQ